jgi:hypothetical protein
MARHVWSLLCEKVVQDSGTQALSIFTVYEDIAVKAQVPAGVEIPGEIVYPLSLTFVSLWERSNLTVEEDKETFKVRIIDPQGKELGTNKVVFSMKGPHVRFRSILNIPQLPIRESGRHVFEVLGRNGNRWKVEAEVPLMINVSVEHLPKPGKPS